MVWMAILENFLLLFFEFFFFLNALILTSHCSNLIRDKGLRNQPNQQRQRLRKWRHQHCWKVTSKKGKNNRSKKHAGSRRSTSTRTHWSAARWVVSAVPLGTGETLERKEEWISKENIIILCHCASKLVHLIMNYYGRVLRSCSICI